MPKATRKQVQSTVVLPRELAADARALAKELGIGFEEFVAGAVRYSLRQVEPHRLLPARRPRTVVAA